MMMTISLIIPIYNAERIIGRTIRSILQQSFQDFELILVDDGSTDGTRALLERYEAQDTRIRTILIANSGPSNARNIGIQHAEGDYTMFVDADDTIEAGMLESLMALTREHDPDMVIFGFDIINVKDGSRISYHDEDAVYPSPMAFKKVLPRMYRENMLNQCWNKVYRTSFLRSHGISFQHFRYGEDRLFVFDCLAKVQKIVVTKDCYYNYFMNAGESLISRFYDRKFEVCNLIDKRLRELSEAIGPLTQEEKDCYAYMHLKSVISSMSNLFVRSCPYSMRKKYEEMGRMLRHEQVKRNSAVGGDNGMAFGLLNFAIRTGIVSLNLFTSWMVSVSSSLAPKLFIQMKHQKQ